MRAFIGVELPVSLREELFLLNESFPKKWDIKLVEKENLHLTLLFLGSISEEQKELILENLTRIGKTGKVNLKTQKLEYFPKSGKKHGVWLSIGGEKEKLFSLYKKIVDNIIGLNINLKKSSLRFSPHIALGRFRSQPCFVELGEFERDFTLESFVLFESKLSKFRPLYTKIACFEL